MNAMSPLKPWREIAVPHEDVLKGTLQQAEFAADLTRVHDGKATPEYQDPVLFFKRTFITEGMRLLLDSVVKRLAGKGGDPVIQLQTAFGGGKTHTLLAVYHLARGAVPASDLRGVPPILDKAGITELPRARIAVLDGVKSSPSQPLMRDGLTIRTLWGDLAWQLGQAEGYALVADADASGTSPGKAVLENLISRYAPCVILIDELVAYVRQFEEGKVLTGGTFDSNLTFVQALTEAIKGVPNALLLASLPESDKEAGSQLGRNTLATLSHYFGRVQALWKPVSAEEAFEIVRSRLFADIGDSLAADTVCRSFADYYRQNASDFPKETQESRYFDRLKNAYPIHPEVFDRLYEDWSSLENFQRTRGVLKLMAKVIYRLWQDNDKDPLIMPGSLPLQDADTRNELIYYLPQGWDPVVERDIDGERAETSVMESQDTRFGSVQACRRSARTIFLGSAPSTANQMVRGIDQQRVALGVALPGQMTGIYQDAVRRLGDCLHYLNSSNNRFWFDTRPNLRREMEDRKRRFHEKDHVQPLVRSLLQKIASGGAFGGVHIFTSSADIPDDFTLRLVVLPPDAAFSRSGQSLAVDLASQILKTRGEQPRYKQNRLIFLAADFDSVNRLRDLVRSQLAWQSIVEDITNLRLNPDQFQAQQARDSLKSAEETVKRTVREAYKWVLTPMQSAQPGSGISTIEWEEIPLNAGTSSLPLEIERVLKDNEFLINEWAPVHLRNLLQNWFWKDANKAVAANEVWLQTCQQLYMPRLKDETVFRKTLTMGAESSDFFGFAQAVENGRYIGFSFGEPLLLLQDSALLLIEPSRAAAYATELRLKAAEAAKGSEPANIDPVPGGDVDDPGIDYPPPSDTPTGGPIAEPVRRFYGTIELDPIQAKLKFKGLIDEVVQNFTVLPGVKVKFRIDIEAEAPDVFDEALQRTVKENCQVLGFKQAGFEKGE